MQQLNATKKAAPAMGSIVRKCVTVLALGLLFTACSKDNDDDNTPTPPGQNPPPVTEESYYASKAAMKLDYQTTDSDGPFNYTLTVLNQKDSAGGKVINYSTTHSEGSYGSSVFVKGSTATFMHSLSTDLADIVADLESDPEVSDFVLTGIPMQQKLPVAPKVGDAITFSEPMHMGWTKTVEGEPFRIDIKVALSEGKVEAFEDITTEAGTFKSCVKWTYKSTVTTETPSGLQVNTSQNTVWLAKGIGLVKSTETLDGNTATTMLKSVTGK